MTNPGLKISIEEARKLLQNWVSTRAKYIKDELGQEDSFEFVFSVRELKKYLEEIETNSSSKNPGIRIYFGANISDSGENTATVFLAPTTGVEANSPNDYNIKPMNRGLRGLPPQMY